MGEGAEEAVAGRKRKLSGEEEESAAAAKKVAVAQDDAPDAKTPAAPEEAKPASSTSVFSAFAGTKNPFAASSSGGGFGTSSSSSSSSSSSLTTTTTSSSSSAEGADGKPKKTSGTASVFSAFAGTKNPFAAPGSASATASTSDETSTSKPAAVSVFSAFSTVSKPFAAASDLKGSFGAGDKDLGKNETVAETLVFGKTEANEDDGGVSGQVDTSTGEEGEDCIHKVRAKLFILTTVEEKPRLEPQLSFQGSVGSAAKEDDEEKEKVDEDEDDEKGSSKNEQDKEGTKGSDKDNGDDVDQDSGVAKKEESTAPAASGSNTSTKKKQWREMGAGFVRINVPKDKPAEKGRVVMRREAVHKLLLNQFLTKDLPIKMMNDKSFIMTFPTVGTFLFRLPRKDQCDELLDQLRKTMARDVKAT